MLESGIQTKFVFNELMTGPEVVTGDNWHAAVYSQRCPGKTTLNEDSAGVVSFHGTDCVLVVADGLGGHAMGHAASSEAVRQMVDAVTSAVGSGKLIRSGIINGFEAANEAIQQMGVGAGTTLAVVEVSDGVARPYHAGDSVVLIVGSRGKVKLETVPHSLVGFGIEAGFLDSDATIEHADNHIVLNVVGSPRMRIEIGPPVALAPQDTILLATDGLTDNVALAQIVDQMRSGPLLESSLQLHRQALGEDGMTAAMKPDDTTSILFRMRRTSRVEPEQ